MPTCPSCHREKIVKNGRIDNRKHSIPPVYRRCVRECKSSLKKRSPS